MKRHVSLVTPLLSFALALAVGLILLGWFIVTAEPIRTPYIAPYELPADMQESDMAIQSAIKAPLFWASRTAEADAEEAEEVVSDAHIDGFRLLGVLGETALVQKGKDDPVKKLRVGETLDGYQVESISGQGVVLVSAGRRVELAIKSQRPSSIVLQPVN